MNPSSTVRPQGTDQTAPSPNLTGLTIPQAENVLQQILAEKADILRQRLTVSSQLLHTSTEIKHQKQELQDYTNLYNEILPSFQKLYTLIYEAPEPKPREEVPPLLPRTIPSSLSTSSVPSLSFSSFPSSSTSSTSLTSQTAALLNSLLPPASTGIASAPLLLTTVIADHTTSIPSTNDNEDMYSTLLKRANSIMGKLSSSSRRTSIDVPHTDTNTSSNRSHETILPSTSSSSSSSSVVPLSHILFNSKDDTSRHPKDTSSLSSTASSSSSSSSIASVVSVPSSNPTTASQPFQNSIHTILDSVQNLESQTIIQQSRLIAGKIMVELNTQETNTTATVPLSPSSTTVVSPPSTMTGTDTSSSSLPFGSENMMIDDEKEISSSSSTSLQLFSTVPSDSLKDTTHPSDALVSSSSLSSFEQERYTYLQDHPVSSAITSNDSTDTPASFSSIPPSSPVTASNENMNESTTVPSSVPPPVLLSPAAAVINSARMNISKSAAENLSKAMDILESVRALSLETSEKLVSTASLQNHLQTARERLNDSTNERSNNKYRSILPPKLPLTYPSKALLSGNVPGTTKDPLTDNNISAILSRVAAVTTEVVSRSRSNSIVDVPVMDTLPNNENIASNGVPDSLPANYNDDVSTINVDNLLQSPTTPLGGSRSTSPVVSLYPLVGSTSTMPSNVPDDSTMDLFTALLQGAAARVQAEEHSVVSPVVTVPTVTVPPSSSNASLLSSSTLSPTATEVLNQKIKEDIRSTETEAAVLGTLALMKALDDTNARSNTNASPSTTNPHQTSKNSMVLPSTADNDLRKELIEVNQQLTNLLSNDSTRKPSVRTDTVPSPTAGDISEELAMRRKKTEELRNQRKAASNKIQAVLHPMPSSLPTTMEEYRPENSLANLYTHVHHSVSPPKDSSGSSSTTHRDSSSLTVTPPGFAKKIGEPSMVRSPNNHRASTASPSSTSPRPVWLPSGKFHNAPDGSITVSKPNSPIGTNNASVRQAVKEAQHEVQGIIQESRQLEELAKQTNDANSNYPKSVATNPSVVSIAKATVTALPEHDARSLVKARLLKQRAIATKDYTLLKKPATAIPPSSSTATLELTNEPTLSNAKAVTTIKPSDAGKKHKLEVVQASVEAAVAVDDVQEGANKLMLIAAESLRNQQRTSRAHSVNEEAIDPMPDVQVPPAELVDTNYQTTLTTNNHGNGTKGSNGGAANALLSPHTAKRKWVQERIGKKK